jgi:hypothetical protein
MNVFGTALAALIVLGLLGPLGAGGYFAFDFVVGLLASLESLAERLTVIATAIGLMAAIIVAGSIRHAAGQIKASRLDAEKGATYRLFVELWQNYLRQQNGSEGPVSTEWSEDLATLDLLLSLYGSAAVIKTHAKLRAQAQERGFQVEDLRLRFVQALVEIRKDFGSDTPRNATGELEKLLFPVTEADNVVESKDARDHTAAATAS